MKSSAPLITNFVAHKDANILLTAAVQEGWKVNVLEKEGSLAELKKGSLTYRTCRSILSANDEVAMTISSDKYLTHLALRGHIPFVTHPSIYTITDLQESEVESLLKKYHKLVVKPLNFNEGIGITTSLESTSAVMEAVEKVKQLGAKRVMIENHLAIVNEFRIIVWKGRVIDVLRRIPAYIIGNGHDTIEKLVNDKNHIRLTKYEGTVYPMQMDDDFYAVLKKQDLRVDSIPEKDRYLKLENTCNLAQGGETERIPVTAIHPQYHVIFKKVYEATHLNYCGIDLICPDIKKAPEVDIAAINELNAAPGLNAAYYADITSRSPFWGVKTLLDAMEHDPV